MAEFTLEQLNQLNAAIVGARLKVSYDGRMVEYRSMDDLIKARNIVRDALAAEGLLPSANNTNRGPSSLAVFGRD